MADLKKRIGIIGGGQLGKMLIESALPLNITCNILENDPDCPAAHSADKLVKGKLTDGNAIRELSAISDVLTYEIEHVDTDTLISLEKEGKTIIPPPRILQIIQDKGLQKQFYTDNQVPTPPFLLVESPSEWAGAIRKLGLQKFVAKSRKGGYDGKGVAVMELSQVEKDPGAIPFPGPTVIEAFVDCDKELSVIVARGTDDSITTYPVVEMVFDPVANLVDTLLCPAQVSRETEKKAREIAAAAVSKLGGPGLFAVEMFLDKAGEIWVNEIAPRPHNSGHHTIEACYTSQYEQLMRILLGLPLGSTELLQAAAMINILGSPDVKGPYRLGGVEKALEIPGVYIHMYRKRESSPMRKLGHATILGPDVETVLEKTALVKQLLRIVADGKQNTAQL